MADLHVDERLKGVGVLKKGTSFIFFISFPPFLGNRYPYMIQSSYMHTRSF
jgi:hypothetical protein